jgi:predicted hydrocarbon binding protein
MFLRTTKLMCAEIPYQTGGITMSGTEKLQVQSLHDELEDCKSHNKVLTILAGEVSTILDEIAKTDEARSICRIMGEDAGRRLGKSTKKRFGAIAKVEEALDLLMYRTGLLRGYGIEIDHIEDGTIYINVLNCFVRDILKDRKLTTASPLCGITCGYIKGALHELTGKDVDVEVVYGDVNGICREKIVIK